MKVCIVLSNSKIPHYAFYNSQEIGLARELIQRGVDVDICTFSKKNGKNINVSTLETNEFQAIRILQYDGVEIPGQQVFSLPLINHFKEKYYEYDVVQLHDSTQLMTVVCAKLLKDQGVHCLLYQGMYRNFDALWKKSIQKIYDGFFMTRLFSNISMVIGKTNAAVDYLINKGLPEIVSRKVIPVGLDASVFNEKVEKDKSSEKKYDILYVGKLEKRRQAMFQANLYLDLCKKNKHFRICVIGKGPESDRFLKKVSTLKKRGQLLYFESIENRKLPDFYRSSKLMLLPTQYEIFGMTILEAMFFGVPVIASAEAGPKDIINNMVDGVLLEDFSVDTWRDTILKLLSDNEKRYEMSKIASDKIAKKFSWKKNAKKFVNSYYGLLNEKKT